MSKLKHEWIKDALTRRGYRQKDLAVAWGSQQASVSRFIAGEELQDLPMSKAMVLARMLNISLDDLAKGLGFSGVVVEPQIEAVAAPGQVPLGTVNMTTVKPGVVRLEIRKDLSVSAAQEVIRVVGTDNID